MPNPRFLTFPDGRLRQLITSNKYTFQDFADMMSVSSVQVRSWVNGKNQPRRNKLARFLEVFGLEIEDQLYSEESADKFSREDFRRIGLGNEDFGRQKVKLDGLAKGRMQFWNALRMAYARHIKDKKDSRWQSLQELAEKTPPPPGLPLIEGQHLRDYPAYFKSYLKDSVALLYGFCVAVYPPFVQHRSLSELSIIGKKMFPAFHYARMDHAKLWNRIGELVDHNAIELQQVMKESPDSIEMINLLCYLEIALIQWCGDRGPGKEHLFRLNKAWHESLESTHE